MADVAEHPAIAVSGSDVYVVWHERRQTRSDVYLKHSPNRGLSWESATRLTMDPLQGAHASIAASGSRVHVTWGGGRGPYGEVYVRSSADRGGTWGPIRLLSNTPYDSWVPTVEASGNDVYVAWVDFQDGNEEEYVRISRDGGVTWARAIRLTHDAADSWAPSLAVSGRAVHLAWFDRRDAGVSDADVEEALNRVLRLIGLEAAPPPPRDPSVYYLTPFIRRVQEKVQQVQAAAPGWVQRGGDARQLEALFEQFLSVMEAWSIGWEIYYKRSRDSGRTWEPDARLTRAPGVSLRPSLAVAGRDVHVVWFDGRHGQAEIYYKHSPDEGMSWGPDVRLTDAHGDSVLPSIAQSGGMLHVVWADQRAGSFDIYYKQRER